MTRAPSLQRRLGLGLATLMLMMWLLATLISGLIVRHELDEAFDSALQETAQRLLPLAVDDLMERESVAPARRMAALRPHQEHFTYVVRDRDGKVLLQSHDADPAVFPPAPVQGFRDTPRHRIYGEGTVSDTIFIEVAEPLTHRDEAAFEASLALLAPLPFLVPLSLVAVWWIVRRSLGPIFVLRAEIETRGGGNLSPVSDEVLPLEIAPIAAAVNRLMDRLRRALDAERSFTANSAHELRTPIAGALAQAQRLIAEAPSGSQKDRARQIERSLQHLARLSAKLMQLARAEAGMLPAATPQDLAPVLSHVIDEFRREDEGGPRLRFAIGAAGALLARMDADGFAILMRNLIENALKHSPQGTPVEVALDANRAVHVINEGPVVAPDVLVRLRNRFERGRTAASGSGLGLAIADAIATGAGARIDLYSPAINRTDGFEAVLTMPPAGPETVAAGRTML